MMLARMKMRSVGVYRFTSRVLARGITVRLVADSRPVQLTTEGMRWLWWRCPIVPRRSSLETAYWVATTMTNNRVSISAASPEHPPPRTSREVDKFWEMQERGASHQVSTLVWRQVTHSNTGRHSKTFRESSEMREIRLSSTTIRASQEALEMIKSKLDRSLASAISTFCREIIKQELLQRNSKVTIAQKEQL